MKKILSGIVIVIVSLILVACDFEGGPSTGDPIQEGVTQLYVGNFDGGYGEEWLNAAKKRFEEKYKDVSFEEGKKGVQVMIRSNRDYAGRTLVDSISNLTQDVFFTEAIYYNDFITQNLLLDISDVVTKPLNYDFVLDETIDGEDKSIESKMYQSHVDFYKTKDEKYFALPFYQAFYGLVYDVDLFEEENLYFAKEGEGNSYGFVIDENTPRSSGPDGNFEDSFDNGLPATYDDFFNLLDYMNRKNIEPILWSGGVQQYLNQLMLALWADFEGKDQMMLNYTFDGIAENLVSYFDDNNNPVIYDEEINTDNGYLVYGNQLGRYHALNFLETIINNKDFYNESFGFSPAQSHRSAQDAFISSKFATNRKSVGILVDGSWWQNEAKPTFLELEKAYGADAKMSERRFGFLPFPKVNEDHLGPQTKFETNFSVSFINANVEEWKQPLAKAFLQFVHTEESLKEFTLITNTFKPFDYKLTEEELNELTYYGRSLYDVHQNAEFVTPYSKNSFYLKNVSNILNEMNLWNAEVSTKSGDKSFNLPSSAFFNDGVTAEEYFMGTQRFWSQTYWNSLK